MTTKRRAVRFTVLTAALGAACGYLNAVWLQPACKPHNIAHYGEWPQ